MGISQIDKLDYYGRLDKFLKNNPEKTEYDFTTNEIDFYNDFIEKLENENHEKQDWEIEYLHNCKKYREYFIDKKRLFENSQNHLSKPKINKSLLFEGRNLNLLDRYEIAKKVLDIEKKIIQLTHTTKEQKNQLLSYILGCDIDSAKKLLNGNYDAKPRQLNTYFNELGINK